MCNLDLREQEKKICFFIVFAFKGKKTTIITLLMLVKFSYIPQNYDTYIKI